MPPPPLAGCVMGCSKGFTLVELLLVLVILGLVTGVAVATFSASATDRESPIVATEMKRIVEAFSRFRMDCAPDDDRLDEIRKYGLWPLAQKTHPLSTGVTDPRNYAEYSASTRSGWAGPYLVPEGVREVDADPDREHTTGRKTCGQETETKDPPDFAVVKVPVFTSTRGDHYRLLSPRSLAGEHKEDRMVLICLDGLSWDRDAEAWIAADGDQQEENLLAELQDRVDHFLYSPESLPAPLSPGEALEELRKEFPAMSILWLLPDRALR